ncbi:hypothetical protein [Paeniglutamicibacter terrestris]|uniref:Helix-turn-helix DNA binding domain protein n=1 Tax=Paeniglutamicibacter terrestris TaxID=2723403 RepID=A0ABX1G618_9MICC|nr:hypothetical protein [Paeniglutamicibacter terrestris]NKG21090.1 hypothetical protein [Paeniglutamicibacter terrestris]
MERKTKPKGPPMICTTNDCGAESGVLYLCPQCVQDLDAWLVKARILLPDLEVTIARLDVVRPASNEGNNGTKSAGSSAPLNVDAMLLKWHLQNLASSADYYAEDQNAAGIAWLIQEWVTKAEKVISGPEGDAPTPARIQQAAIDIREQVPEALSGKDLSLWLKNVHHMTVYPFRIRKWAERGHITRTNVDGRPTYSPAATLIYARKDLLQRHSKKSKV